MENFIRIALKASNGKYVTVSNNGNVLCAISETIEVFQMIHTGEKMIALKAHNRSFVSCQQNGELIAYGISEPIGLSEQFEVYDWGDNKLALHASNQKYVSLIQSNATFKAMADEFSDAEIFSLEILPDADTFDSELPILPQISSLESSNPPSQGVYTICFCGTGCTRDEGEVTRPESNKGIYSTKTGYIPVRIHKEITGDLRKATPSVTIRGVGENDWAVPRNDSERLKFDGPLNADPTLLSYIRKYSGGNQLSRITMMDGWSAPALALHAANLAASSGKQQYNFIGHSRGAVECIMAAWFLYAYGSQQVKNIPINIFAIDPVPGTGDWYGILTQLPPNVVSYVGVYAWDMCIQPEDKPFMALVPRPNGLMTRKNNNVTLKHSWWPWNRWKYIADDAQLTDPLAAGIFPQPLNYELYACRGRHSTVAGNSTANGEYNPNNISNSVVPVSELIYKMARGYLTKWGTVFKTESAVNENVLSLRKKISTNHREFDLMGGGETRNSIAPFRPYVRRISSIHGRNTLNSYYMDNVVGDPPYKMAYSVTKDRTSTGWVKWKFL